MGKPTIVITREGISLTYGIAMQITHIHNFNYEGEENYVLTHVENNCINVTKNTALLHLQLYMDAISYTK